MTLKQNCVKKKKLGNHYEEGMSSFSLMTTEGKGIAKTSETRIETFKRLESIYFYAAFSKGQPKSVGIFNVLA